MGAVEKNGARACRKVAFSLDFRAALATLVSGETELGPGGSPGTSERVGGDDHADLPRNGGGSGEAVAFLCAQFLGG